MPEPALFLVTTRDQAEAAMGIIAALALQLNEVVNLKNAALLAAGKHDGKIKEFQQRLQRYEQALEDWARKNRKEFVEGKTLDLRQGIISFRNRPPAVEFLKGCDEASVLVKLRKVEKWGQYIRVKETLNRQLILADYRPEVAKLFDRDLRAMGLEIATSETFLIKPKLEEPPVLADK